MNGKPPYNPPNPNWSTKFGLAPFGLENVSDATNPRVVRFKDITDGTSHTMLLSEVVCTSVDDIWDVRGDMLNDGEGCTQYMTIDTPNTSVRDVTPYCIPSPATADNPPGEVGAYAHKAARSRHPGGVNVVFADCSLRFITDDILQPVWQALGTMNGSDTTEGQ
jgi:prepilin-type processing-associated H-X9-DG protein